MVGDNQPQFFNTVCRRYTALLKELPHKVYKDLKNFFQWASVFPEKWALLQEPSLSHQWQEIFFQAFYDHHPCHPISIKFLMLLGSHKRLSSLPLILKCFVYETREEKPVYLRIAKRLSSLSLKSFSESLRDQWKMPVSVKQIEDPSLLLGGIIIWDTYMIDSSLKFLLTSFKNEISHEQLFS